MRTVPSADMEKRHNRRVKDCDGCGAGRSPRSCPAEAESKPAPQRTLRYWNEEAGACICQLGGTADCFVP